MFTFNEEDVLDVTTTLQDRTDKNRFVWEHLTLLKRAVCDASTCTRLINAANKTCFNITCEIFTVGSSFQSWFINNNYCCTRNFYESTDKPIEMCGITRGSNYL